MVLICVLILLIHVCDSLSEGLAVWPGAAHQLGVEKDVGLDWHRLAADHLLVDDDSRDLECP